MPFLRFSRDKRGYESTYLLHTFRSEGGSKPRLLYWFRTPPSLRVGRYPFDEEAIRSIEASNPNLSFDWSKMLKVRPVSVPTKNTVKKRISVGDRDRSSASAGKDASDLKPVGKTMSLDLEQEEQRPNIVLAEEEESTESVDAEWRHPVAVLMGDEMLARLRGRHTEIQVRIAEKWNDLKERDSINARAENLNPDSWRTLEDAVRGIEKFEAEAREIKNLLGRRPPRGRREHA